MNGTYEHSWQEAMAGATIEPSEALWNNIASSMDTDRGRNYWVTLLLIAATISIAFAIPLSMGTLDYNAQPNHNIQIGQATEPTDQIINNKNQVTNNASSQSPTNQNTITPITNEQLAISNKQLKELSKDKNQVTNNASSQSPTNQNTLTPIANEQLATNNKQLNESTANKNQNAVNAQTIIAKTQFADNPTANNQILATNSLKQTEANGSIELSRLGTTRLSEIESYYFVPYFMPIEKDKFKGTNLLASLNMGTGSVSNNPPGGSFAEALFANDQTPNLNDVNKNTTERSENPGTAYYIGAGVEFPLGKKWSLLTGLGYRAQHAMGTSDLIFESEGVEKPLGAYAPIVAGTSFLSNSYEYSVTNSYLSVPVAFKYPFINKRVMLRGGLGVSTDFMLSHKISSEAYGNASYSPEEQNYQRLLLGGVATIDLSYSLNNQYSIAFET